MLGAERSDQYLKTFQQEISMALTIIVQTSSGMVLNTRWEASPCLNDQGVNLKGVKGQCLFHTLSLQQFESCLTFEREVVC